MAEVGLLEWADKQHDWIRDALRRHAARPGFNLEQEDKADVAAQVRHVGGFTVDLPECSPLSAEHLRPNSSNEPRAVLCSLGPVKHLNRLAEEQQLRFATDGITIIYGDNGSGKSGYCRIAKKLCRSLTADDLLGNVFEIGAKPPAEVLVRFLEEGATEPTPITWKDGTLPPASIARISVFDSANARLYVDKQNRIGFLPATVALLESHGRHRSELEADFREEIKAIEKNLKTPLPGGYTAAGAVAKLLARLEIKSKDVMPSAAEIKKLAALSEQEMADLAGLEQALASDPSTMAIKRRRAKAALEKLLTASEQIDAALSADAVEIYRNLYATADSTAKAAHLAASGAFATMPLSGVGLSPWRSMFDHARAYAASVTGTDHQHLPDQEGDRCLLCQEPMTADAAGRIRSFNDFVTGAANKAAQVASVAHEEALRQIKGLAIATAEAVEAALGEFGDLSAARKAMVALIVAYYVAAGKRRDAIAGAAALSEYAAFPQLAAPVASKVRAEAEALEAEALTDDKAAADDGNRAIDRARRDTLKDRKKLGDDLTIIVARLANLEERRKLLSCCDAVETGSVSRQMTSLRRSLVMENLEKRVVAEIEALALTHIPFAVNDRSQDGQSYFEVGLNAAKTIPNSKVLSEGEQRALALACFLAEVGGDTSRQGMIIDDPVSSLDHVRIRRVAARLVKEAATGRQIIIFTHNLLFFNEVVDAAAQANPPIPLVRNYINKSESAGFGLISETDEPWIAQSVTKRIDTLKTRLKSFDGATDFTTDAWRRSAKDFYTDLRETWERLVEEILLGKVVERFNSDVKTQSLKGVVVEDEDHKRIFWAMKRVSERSGHDMASAKAIPVPIPADMKGDLDGIDQYRIDTIKRKKDAEKRRIEFEQPPKATML
ncbi:AAA family ATPase [Mesorhizobium sp. M0118]|uniref:AAA family ATPase n=1 Tax=Mesorhizobium sp. M0118 TaxID=2956884 RepID=UPI0033350A3A